MIIGVGVDLCDIRRIERALDAHGERFEKRCFTPVEQALARRRKNRAATYAKRFAAKEACAKALGTGFQGGVRLVEIGVVNDALGRPSLQLTGRAAQKLAELTPKGFLARLHLTLTDEYPLAQAQVFIEALAAEDRL